MHWSRRWFSQFGLAALLICGSNIRTEALTNIVVNGALEHTYGGWDVSGTLEVNSDHVVFGGLFWQDLSTVPGRDYIVRFIYKNSQPRLRWGNEAYESFTNWPSTFYGWQTVYRHVHATAAVTRLTFEAVTTPVGLNDVLVGWLGEPASIVTQPQSRSTPDGGSASFFVGADGGPPLRYQWLFNDNVIPGATNHYFIQQNVGSAHAGDYHVIVSNIANSVTSSVATLTVDPSPKEPVIVYHPETQDIPAGYVAAFRTAAVGSVPISYQWYLNALELPDATNSVLTFAANFTNAGTYTVRASNRAGSVLSLPGVLGVYPLTNAWGGNVRVSTIPIPRQQVEVPIYDVDGVTRLTRSNFVAQLYTGPSPETLRPNGDIVQFNSLFPGTVQFIREVPDYVPGELVYGQLKAWEAAAGSCYEEARARGGRFGFSTIVSVQAPGILLPAPVFPFKSFSLRYGLPEFTMGKLEVSQRLPDGTIEWALSGEPGFRYLVEKRLPPDIWQPLTIVTNDTGRVTFRDSNQQNSSLKFYRSRMLD